MVILPPRQQKETADQNFNSIYAFICVKVTVALPENWSIFSTLRSSLATPNLPMNF